MPELSGPVCIGTSILGLIGGAVFIIYMIVFIVYYNKIRNLKSSEVVGSPDDSETFVARRGRRQHRRRRN